MAAKKTEQITEQRAAAPKRAYRRVIAKFGTGLLTGGGDRLDIEVMADLAR